MNDELDATGRGGSAEGDHPLAGLLGELEEEAADSDQRHPLTRKEVRLREAEALHPHRKTPKRRGRGIAIFLTVLLGLGGLGAGVVVLLQGPLQSLLSLGESDDYDGEGTGSTTVVVEQGDSGLAIAKKLEAAGVVKSSSSFYSYLLALSTQPTFQPGTYVLATQMSNKSALAALLDDANRSTRSVTIPEGYSVDQIFSKLEDIGFDADQLTALRKDPQQFGIPSAAIDLEGFLFPATYAFDESTTAKQAIQTMVDRTFTSLDSLGVKTDDRLSTVVLASIIQKEAGADTGDMAKIARVFLNRIAQGMLLQSDATVAYGAGSTGTVWTTSAQRADASNKFNTYVHKGLPPGAISNPGDDALDAAVNPASGDWLFFTVVNLQTGETVFSTDAAGHNAAVLKLSQWCQESAANAAYCS